MPKQFAGRVLTQTVRSANIHIGRTLGVPALARALRLIAAPHPKQIARLAALRAYDILDTPREADYDAVVALASQICGVPISVVNLIDADRQWFKAEIGLGVRETPLETSICSHVILEDDFVEISDTLLDRRMADNELCLGNPGLRFYAGATLRTGEGLPLGTLCVLDYEPRQLTQLQRDALKVLASQLMTQLELRLALKRQTLLSKEIDHRVKNSLQAVSALVRLQRSKSNEESVRAALDQVSQRIETISLLHEELYNTSAIDQIDLAHYFPRLGKLLQRNAPDNVAISVQSASALVDSHFASSLGMIVSEFVANSIKHGFPEGRAGAVAIAARHLADGRLELTCTDDGVGTKKNAKGGLGLRLMEASASQLGGKFEQLDAATGFGVRVTFPT